VKRIPANVNLADLDFDPEDPTSQNTYSLGRFLYEGDTSTIHSDVPMHFAETLDTLSRSSVDPSPRRSRGRFIRVMLYAAPLATCEDRLHYKTRGMAGSRQKPAVRGATIEPLKSTQLRHWPRGFGASAT
jgi:hypothetical protein